MFTHNPTAQWIILTCLNLPIFIGLGYLLFGSWSGFWECVCFWFTPDWISLLKGEWLEDNWAELKLFVFLILCGVVVYGEHEFFFSPMSPPSAVMNSHLEGVSSGGMQQG